MQSTADDPQNRWRNAGAPGGPWSEHALELDPIARHELGMMFRIERLLAEQPGALTYLARERGRGRPVVLRVRELSTLEAPGLLDSLEQALSEVAALEHPNVVPIYAFGRTRRTVWWASQFVRGGALTDLIRGTGPLDLDRLIRIFEQVANGLLKGHERGVAHGNVRLENVLVREQDWAVIKDFAILPPLDEGLGAAKYQRTPAEDQRALAIAAYRCLTGLVEESDPIPADAGLVGSIIQRRPDLPSSVSVALGRALAPNSAQRFGSILDFVRSLRRELKPGTGSAPGPIIVLPDDQPADESGPPPLVLIDNPRRSRRWVAPVAVAATTAAVALAVFQPWNSDAGSGFVGLNYRASPPPAAATPVPPAPATPVPVAPAPTAGDTARPTAPADRVTRFTVSPPPAPGRSDTARRPPSRDSRLASAPAGGEPAPSRSDRGTRSTSPERVRERAIALPPPIPEPAAPARALGRLSVSSRPWGELYVDGRLVGFTPKADVPIAPGRHQLRISRSGFRDVLREITVVAGQEVRLIDVILEEANQ